MKYLHILSSFLLILFAACGDGRQQRLQLEELERMNRADSVMTNDSLARDLADWFDRHGTPNEQLRAYYMLGRTYADRGEYPQALEAYNDAADRADTTATDCDYKTLSRVHAQKAELYYYQLLPDNMIREERQAMRYAKTAKDTMQYIACYGILAEGYETKNKLDSALAIFSKVYNLYNLVGKNELAAGICCSMADVYRQKRDYTKARECMQDYENNSGFFDDEGNIIAGKEMYYSCKGLLCLETSDKENAEYYFRKLLNVADTYDLKIAALSDLQRFYTIFFNKDSLVKYSRLSDSICSTAHNEIEMQKTLQVQAMYDYNRSEQIARQKNHEAERFRTTLIIVVALLVILILLSVIAFIRYQDEQQRLKERIEVLRGYAINQSLYDSPIAERFRQLLKANPYRHPDFNDWKELALLFDREIPDFRKALTPNDEPLSDFEYDVCMLTKIQISPSDIARIKQCKPSHITQTRKHIYEKRFSRKGKAYELDEFIMKQS